MPLRRGYRRIRADEFIPVGLGAASIGVYWIDDSGARRERLLFQVATLRDARIARLQGYRTRKRALKAARAAGVAVASQA